ncbi:hypothetical protein [Phosphitispora sp. TUW77]|uniref:hypothetical protein n=1 Tax=Phosphitispora sp. TUW77 TaxID=3152361 RepID=UPI003AB5E128
MHKRRYNPQVNCNYNYNYNYMMPYNGYLNNPGTACGAYPGTHVPGGVAGVYSEYPGGYSEMHPGMHSGMHPGMYPGMYQGYCSGQYNCDYDHRDRHYNNFPWWLIVLPFIFPVFGPFF